ncbi:EF-hand domain-containing protein d1 [Plakobranchus ocellatus]|uniref:EF-hand domain-containing protein d1 n=1 Tax=Plakobranchus ocellatus TaxID=259542 RepID=A0AAV4B4L2_9GAST|nr:EF-hand domain-containing protein d1 [Plakobranchus ocellatus]
MKMCGLAMLTLSSTYLVVILLLEPAKADFEQKMCDNYATSNKPLTKEPNFFNDYSVEIEKIIYTNFDSKNGQIVQQTLEYSGTHNQLMLYEQTKNTESWSHVDVKSNDCIQKINEGPCTDTPDTCSSIADSVVYVTENNGQVGLEPFTRSLRWPTEKVKKKVDLGSVAVRGVSTEKYATCVYEPSRDETTVSVWFFVDSEKYKEVDQNHAIPLLVFHRTKRRGSFFEYSRTEFLDYKKLSPFKIKYGLQIPELQCGSVRSKFMSKRFPETPPRYKCLIEVDVSDNSSKMESNKRYIEMREYNSYSKFLVTQNKLAEDHINEKEIMKVVEDVSTDITYFMSLTNGVCTVVPKNANINFRAPSEEAFWHLDGSDISYWGVFYNRDIPCDVWYMKHKEKSYNHRLYLATSEWLKQQGKEMTEFYPIQVIKDYGDEAYFNAFYEFEISQDYYIPPIFYCFEEDDSVYAEVTLLINYNTIPSTKPDHFTYEFRSLIKKITGIVSSLRIGSIYFFPSQESEDETIVRFMIYGKMKGAKDKQMYEADSVTSQEAVDKIKEAVHKGSVTFTLDDKTLEVELKQGSFAVMNRDEIFMIFDDEAGGHSAGAMAAVGIVLLLVGLALGTGALFGYKRWTDRTSPSLPSGIANVNFKSEA